MEAVAAHLLKLTLPSLVAQAKKSRKQHMVPTSF